MSCFQSPIRHRRRRLGWYLCLASQQTERLGDFLLVVPAEVNLEGVGAFSRRDCVSVFCMSNLPHGALWSPPTANTKDQRRLTDETNQDQQQDSLGLVVSRPQEVDDDTD